MAPGIEGQKSDTPAGGAAASISLINGKALTADQAGCNTGFNDTSFSTV
jgi:hypothetical protein